MRRLSSAKEEREMGLIGSNSKFKKKFGQPRKVLRDCNTVNHALVPRKLRSAMKKRSCESVSPPLLDKKNPNYAIDRVRSTGGEGKKKLRVNRKDDFGNDLITKDEEEAVETLFALAEMFQTNNKMTESKSPPLAPENEETAQETLEVKCSIDQLVSLTAQPVYPKPSCVSISGNFDTEPSMITNFKQLVHKEVAAPKRRPEIAVAVGAVVGGLHERHLTTENSKIIGLWPGLSSAVPLRAETKGSPMISPGAYYSVTMSSSKNGTLTDEVSRDPVVRNKSRKRCIAHVHIVHLIKGMQGDEKRKNNPMQPLNQLTEIEIPKQEARLDKSVVKIGNASSDAEKDQNKIRNAVLLHKRLLQDSQQPSPTPTLYPTSKHNFDFLSLTTGGGAVEAIKTATKTGNWIEPWSQFHLPYQSISQNHTNIPFSHPQSHYSNVPFTDCFPVTAAKQVQMQIQSYASNPVLGPTQLGNASSPSQHQQRISTSHFSSQYKPMGLSSPHNNPNMQNRKLDPPISIPFAPSLELLHPMYIPMLPHQGHNLIPLTSSLPNCRAKMPYHHPLPSSYKW